MQWTDFAIVVNVKRFSENKAIIHLLTQNHGLHKGIVNNIDNKNQVATYQIGNLVQANWYARMPEHIGNYSLELIKQILSYVLYDKAKLLILQSFSQLILHGLAEAHKEDVVFNASIELLESIKTKKDCFLDYLYFELTLLKELGFALDLSKCGVSGTKEDLVYVSPKTARAITQKIGLEYHDKLLQLPEFLAKRNDNFSINELLQGYNLTGYFLNKHLFAAKDVKFPKTRFDLVNEINKKGL